MFGKEHLSYNRKANNVKQVIPWIWGEADRVILMLEVKHSKKNCTSSRNVVFLLDTSAPYTVISPELRKLVLADCQLKETTLEKLSITINGRESLTRLAKDYYSDTNVLGMDFMKANNV